MTSTGRAKSECGVFARLGAAAVGFQTAFISRPGNALIGLGRELGGRSARHGVRTCRALRSGTASSGPRLHTSEHAIVPLPAAVRRLTGFERLSEFGRSGLVLSAS